MKLTSYDIIKTYERILGLDGWYNPCTLSLDSVTRTTNLPAWKTGMGLYMILETGWSYSPSEREFTLTVGDEKYTVTHTPNMWVVRKPGDSKGAVYKDALKAFREIRALVHNNENAYCGKPITTAILYGIAKELGACKWSIVDSVDDTSSTWDVEIAPVNKTLTWKTRAGKLYTLPDSWDFCIEKMHFTRTLYGYKATVYLNPHLPPHHWEVILKDLNSQKEAYQCVDSFEYLDEAISQAETLLSSSSLERAYKSLLHTREQLNTALNTIEEILNTKE